MRLKKPPPNTGTKKNCSERARYYGTKMVHVYTTHVTVRKPEVTEHRVICSWCGRVDRRI